MVKKLSVKKIVIKSVFVTLNLDPRYTSPFYFYPKTEMKKCIWKPTKHLAASKIEFCSVNNDYSSTIIFQFAESKFPINLWHIFFDS